MTNEEHQALKGVGLTLHKLLGRNFSEVSLSSTLKRESESWELLPDPDKIEDFHRMPGTNTLMFAYKGRFVGLSLDKDTGRLGVRLDHPMSKVWLGVLQPIWDEQNSKLKCKTCRDTGWDGIGYTMTCVDCGGREI